MSTFKYCPLIWVFCGKIENKSINKIQKRTLRLIYDTKDANFEYLLERHKSRTVHENKLQKLLIRYNLRRNYLLKLPDTSTCRYDTQALCFKGSLLWNKIPNKYKI